MCGILSYMKIFFNAIKQWWNSTTSTENQSGSGIPITDTKYKWEIKPDITAYELSHFIVRRSFMDQKTVDEWYDKLPASAKRHIKKLN